MGHTWREMDGAGAAQHDNNIEIQIKLRDFLERKSLSEFTVKELPMLLRVLKCEAYMDDIVHFKKRFKDAGL